MILKYHTGMKHNQDGAVNGLLLPLIFSLLLLAGALGFGGWAFTQRQDYKNNVDKKVADAVIVARQQESTLKDKQFAEAYKLPLKDYVGPSDLGAVFIKYPKTWSSYVATSKSSTLIDGYFANGTVPTVNDQNSIFSLRFQVVEEDYADVVKRAADTGKTELRFEPYALPLVTKSIGVRATGKLDKERTGVMVILPLRDKTLKVWTEGTQFTKDFDENILPNLTFAP